MSTDRQKYHLEEDGVRVRRQSEIVKFSTNSKKGQWAGFYTILAFEVAQGAKASCLINIVNSTNNTRSSGTIFNRKRFSYGNLIFLFITLSTSKKDTARWIPGWSPTPVLTPPGAA